jgi:pyruvate carboxylase
MLGDIVKVTPTSKAVGDMALFMVANDLSVADVLDPKRDIVFPQSVIDLVIGRMGQNPGGFPKEVRDRILRGEKPLKGRPGASLPPADFEEAGTKLAATLGREPSQRDIVSYLLYPKIFEDFAAHEAKYSDTSVLPTPAFFFGLEAREEITLDIEEGKTLIVKFSTVSDSHADGTRTVFFELNGQPREVTVVDHSLAPSATVRKKAEADDPRQVGASLPGMVVTVAVQVGDRVAKGQKLFLLEAMKMQATLVAERSGKVAQVLVQPGTQVEIGDLLLVLE